MTLYSSLFKKLPDPKVSAAFQEMKQLSRTVDVYNLISGVPYLH